MFVELHAQSAFSFLEGADLPETLVTEAARLGMGALALVDRDGLYGDRKSTRLNSSHGYISYAVFCLKKKQTRIHPLVIERPKLPALRAVYNANGPLNVSLASPRYALLPLHETARSNRTHTFVSTYY